MKQDEDKARPNSKMESTVRELPEIVEETVDQDGQEGTEIQYSSWDMVEFTWDVLQYSSWDMVEYTWDEHHSKIMRACLQFCYLFPQDYEFQKNDLILLWIAEELLSVAQNETPAYSELVDRGSLYFEEFEKMNIFTLSSLDHSTHLQRYKLNKSVFHLLQQHHDDAYSRVDVMNSYFPDNTLHSSIYDSSIDAITLEKLYHAKRLRTLLMLHESGSKLDHVPREVFLKLPWISVLDLSGTNIKEVPSSIGKLKNLRYLNLSGTSITRLPESVCSLYQMRILKLKACLKFVSLPKGMRRLVKLQYLHVDVARLLVSMPPGLGDLTDLHHLPAFVVGKESGCCITELNEMVNLHGALRILRLENVSSSKEAANAALDRKKHVVKLQLQWTEFHDGLQFEVLQNLQPHTQIEELQIVGFAGLEFPSWIGDPQFSKLVKVTLHDCRKCKRLPPLGKLPFLKHLFISDMHEVQVIDTLFCGRDMVGGLPTFAWWLRINATTQFKYNNMFLAFPSLENLTLNGMPALEKWIGIEKGDFHHLQKLSITCCHKLTSIPELSLLVSLQQLEISLCTSLKSLPNKGLPISLQCLVIMECPLLKEWCLKEAEPERGKLAGIPNIWIDYLQISMNTEVSDSGRNLTARQQVYESRAWINKPMEVQLVNHGKNKKLWNMKETIFGKNSKDEHNEKDSERKVFAYKTLVSATNDFHVDHKLGEGRFGAVYKGKLDDGREVAVKKLSRSSNQGKREFMNEAELLLRVHHMNVLNLLGYCFQGSNKSLVYEYLHHQSLDKFLSRSRKQELDWKKRYDVIIGVARGLHFLHDHYTPRIIHCDIKASNILLDEKWTPKITDFGMARLFPVDQTHTNIRVDGADGYMAPEYVMHGQVSVKADVYSFGVLVLELISGGRNSTFDGDKDAHNLLDWAWKLYKKKRSLEMIDAMMVSEAATEQVEMCIKIGLLCVQADPKLRPTMQRVVLMLSEKSSIHDEPRKPGYPELASSPSTVDSAAVSSSMTDSFGGSSKNFEFSIHDEPRKPGYPELASSSSTVDSAAVSSSVTDSFGGSSKNFDSSSHDEPRKPGYPELATSSSTVDSAVVSSSVTDSFGGSSKNFDAASSAISSSTSTSPRLHPHL